MRYALQHKLSNSIIILQHHLFCAQMRLYVSPGILSCLDGYMNAALENTEEVVNGKVTNKYGDAFVRGNNSKLDMMAASACFGAPSERLTHLPHMTVLYITRQ